MDAEVAIRRADVGRADLKKNDKTRKRREDYLHGIQDKPWAPDGIGAEHESLREQSMANWMPLPVFAPIQRMRCEGMRSGLGDEIDKERWRNQWHANRMEARQTIIYESMMTHGRGIGSVWVNDKDRSRPVIRPQSVRNVYLHSDDDPFETDYAVKVVTRPTSSDNGFILPDGVTRTQTIAHVYDKDSWVKLIDKGGSWEAVAGGSHPMGRVPFVTFDYRPDANGQVFSPIDPLIPQQNAINTIRFNMLLAMQFSAFRQRVVTGFDPVMRDEAGQIVYKKNPDGSTFRTSDGRMVPLLNEFGRAAVDRMLVFNGDQTKVFDMPESNLANYVTMLTEFLTQFFATSQVPPQYLLSRMANLSGDAISGAESTLTSLQGELKRYANEGMVEMFTMSALAADEKPPHPDMEMLYADTEVKSFAQVVDGIQKLITTGFPREAAYEMLPGANQSKVARWMSMADDEMARELDALKVGGDGLPDSSDTALQLAAGARRSDAQVG